jgi:hypothetical protein
VTKTVDPAMSEQATQTSATTSAEVRERIVEALRLDLVGPWAEHELAEERLPGWQRPSNWYLTGFLIPSDTPLEEAADEDVEDDFGDATDATGLAEESHDDRKAAKKSYFPSSMGLSFLVAAAAKELRVLVRWGDYAPCEIALEGSEKPMPAWQRTSRAEEVVLALSTVGHEPHPVDVPNAHGLQLVVVARAVDTQAMHGQVPVGTRSVSVFLVNHRRHDPSNPDLAYAFQPELIVHSVPPFVPRPNLRGLAAADLDEQIADLHYADSPEFAAGHGVSVDWQVVDGFCREVRTAWIPAAEVERTATAEVAGVELDMATLGRLADGAGVRSALTPLVTEYRAWITAQGDTLKGLTAARREVAEHLLHMANVAATRIERGIEVLATDAAALDAFRVANRAVAAALTKRLADAAPRWRAFQLAFLLLNLPGMVDPTDPNRETVDLLFFPTGGGKTEAYLGLAAFSMVLRRLQHPGLTSAGVCVMMRYTLRLLTLDQLGRAAGLVCALELERLNDPQRYGLWPFEIGLWVGKAATPNVIGRKGDKRNDTARAKTIAYKNNPHHKPPPIPLEACPWCNRRFGADSFSLRRDGASDTDAPNELRVVCLNSECEFSGDRALPILAVDQQIYQRLPAFLIATVDKFATLPWVGESGMLLGSADRADARGFYGPVAPGRGKGLSTPLPPMDLVIQDELHLISGPLGTMAGLYETVIDALSTRSVGRTLVRPKVVASTATVRRAQDQIQALFARAQTQVFPPPGPDRRDSFFAQSLRPERSPARRYVGVAAQGRNPKVVMRRTWLALMSAAQNSFMDAGGHKVERNAADPYMTVLGYFNSLRELGGARRILEEEVQNTLKSYGLRRRVGETRRLFRDRTTWSEVVELTSRVSTDQVAVAKRRLEATFGGGGQRVDCAIATNMISVGLDIPRLGLMVVMGQPKSHSEYIQATSRVGRSVDKPGLVVTLLNIHKPRDRSHYERFRQYHETFYRSVEVSSVTPFSPRALDRGFAGAMVALARHSLPVLAPALAPRALEGVRVALEKRLLETFEARVRAQAFGDEGERKQRLRSVHHRVIDLLDSWLRVVKEYEDVGARVQYQQYEDRSSPLPKPLLREMLDTNFDNEHHAKFRANRSLRDVEPPVNLYLVDLNGKPVEDHA